MKIETMTFLKQPPKGVKFTDANLSLLIRPLDVHDAACVHKAVMDSLRNLLPFMNWAHLELTKEGQKKRLFEAKKNCESGIELGVFEQDTGNFLMSASLTPSLRFNGRALEIGYWVHSNYCNKGLATLVTKILVIMAFEHMLSDRVGICCNLENFSSKKVIEKCGFRLEGRIRNFYSQPTKKMVENGYCLQRDGLFYGLIPADKPNLSWYIPIRSQLQVS